MKNRPLYLQIWLVFAGITIGTTLFFMILVPWTLRGFFTAQMYDTIRESQQLYLSDEQFIEIKDLAKWEQRSQQYRSVKHMVFLDNGHIVSGVVTPSIQANINDILLQANTQRSPEQQYVKKIEDEHMYYVIRKGTLGGNQVYLLSYLWESYQDELVFTLFRRLLWIMAGLLIFSWLPSFWLARYLSRPLMAMEGHVRRIANRDWHESFECDRKDEIGMLAQSIERMRDCLVKQDEAQQSFMQYISHELKTPVMVIRSYAQAIADGIFPKDGLEGTVKVIDEEAERLEKRIQDLLYLSKLDYFSSREAVKDNIKLAELLQNVVDLLRWKKPELKWVLDIEDLQFKGDYEQWKIALENLLDNQIRYAASSVSVSIKEDTRDGKNIILLRIGNDGPPIEDKVMEKLFEQFEKGSQGQIGLGLAIVQQIAFRHNARVWASNEDDGPAFYIEIQSEI